MLKSLVEILINDEATKGVHAFHVVYHYHAFLKDRVRFLVKQPVLSHVETMCIIFAGYTEIMRCESIALLKGVKKFGPNPLWHGNKDFHTPKMFDDQFCNT